MFRVKQVLMMLEILYLCNTLLINPEFTKMTTRKSEEKKVKRRAISVSVWLTKGLSLKINHGERAEC